ncbi:hypothetical protein SH1V18_21770 [Vallitalea longa]|uniref:DUF11 domain-containing protein n=1 Tax=Vallitalea longa TaxID=2936439 RepID=A0A9W5YA39_9FIRM|nr:hypothetical protein [Vallitalea longa]GKX29697.1 hypothetical protein SH1V18_21770 [Vallitalea longa]
MAFDPNLFTINVTPDPSNILLGKDGTVTIAASNSNPGDWGYNYSLVITIPDGVSFVSADIPATSEILNVDNSITLTWLDITDLAPGQTGFEFNIVLQSDENFRETGLPVPFNSVLTPVSVSATVDTLPRGDAEPGNIKYTKDVTTSVVALQYQVTKDAPGKVPKGAGIPSGASPQWPYEYELVIHNNTRSASIVDITDILDNGIRFIGPITASGPDSAQLIPPNPVVTTPSPGGQDNVTIEWTNVSLSANSTNTVNFIAAIWDNYTVGGIENSGARIPHLTPMNNQVTIDGASGPVTDEVDTLAMDLLITKSQDPTDLVIGSIINYTLNYRVNQYDSLNSVIVTDRISDGQTFQSAVPVPTSVSAKDPITGSTTIIWDLGSLGTSTSGTITFSTIVDTDYFVTSQPVLAGDFLTNEVEIDGINDTTSTDTPDSSFSFGQIDTPSIDKQLLNYYYEDGTLKPASINALAPGDFAEFQITYDAPLNPPQMDVMISDFFPLVMDASTITSIVYNPFPPTSGPTPTGNEGVEWLLDTNVPGMTNWTVTFRVQMKNTEFIGTSNNLAKLSLLNTNNIVFSDRDQVEVNFGEPDIQLTKDVAGPTPNNIMPGQTYTYTVVINNPQNVDGTIVDAFSVDFSDVIPNLLTYVPLSLTANATAGTPSFSAPIFTAPDQIFMEILQLGPDDEITLTYEITVDAGIGPNLDFINDARTTSPYSQPFDPGGDNYQYPDLEREDSATLSSGAMPVMKTVDNDDVVVGDTVYYTITWTVPEGLIAYDVSIRDILPIGQSYDGDPSPVPPQSIIGQVVRWPTIPTVDATGGAITLIYSFRARIDSSDAVPPTYTEVQTNRGRIFFNSTPGGSPMVRGDTVDVTVSNPHITITKEERNVSKCRSPFDSTVTATGGQIIEYMINVVNDGSADAYDIEVIDRFGGLNSGLNFIQGSIEAPIGTTADYNAATNQVVWDIPFLAIGDSLSILFRVRITRGPILSTVIYNDASVASYSNINLTFIYPREDSNSVAIVLESRVRGKSLSELAKLKDLRIK